MGTSKNRFLHIIEIKESAFYYIVPTGEHLYKWFLEVPLLHAIAYSAYPFRSYTNSCIDGKYFFTVFTKPYKVFFKCKR